METKGKTLDLRIANQFRYPSWRGFHSVANYSYYSLLLEIMPQCRSIAEDMAPRAWRRRHSSWTTVVTAVVISAETNHKAGNSVILAPLIRGSGGYEASR